MQSFSRVDLVRWSHLRHGHRLCVIFCVGHFSAFLQHGPTCVMVKSSVGLRTRNVPLLGHPNVCWPSSPDRTKLVGRPQFVSSSLGGHKFGFLLAVSYVRARCPNDTGGLEKPGSDFDKASKLKAVDVATGAVDVTGWLVFLKSEPEFVGKVEEIVALRRLADCDDDGDLPQSYLLSVREVRGQRGHPVSVTSERPRPIEFLVPLVDEFVRDVDEKAKHLHINPPDGLLELARRPEALRKLRPSILEFCSQQVDGVADYLQEQSEGSSSKDTQVFRRVHPNTKFPQSAYMPTRRQLLAAGRQDLVESIIHAGGFLSVAQALRLPARRRPNGFWDDIRNLDAEIEWFITSSWVKQVDPTTGKYVYVNEVTRKTSLDKPRITDVSNPTPVSHSRNDIGTAAMPREKTLKNAGRYDLHHAIALHGGYRSVAQELGRQTVPYRRVKTQIKKKNAGKMLATLEEQIRLFMEEKGLSHFPSIKELRSARHGDLVRALYQHGGLGVVADHMGIRPKRYGKSHWVQLERAAAVLRAYLLQKLCNLQKPPIDSTPYDDIWAEALRTGSLSIPQEAQLMADERPDLRYLIRKFGQAELAEHLQIGERKLHVRYKKQLKLASPKFVLDREKGV